MAILGAPGSGRHRLTAALAQAGVAAHIVPAESVHTALGARCILLMGLDLAADAASAAVSQAADARIRNQLADQGARFQVVYGHPDARLRNALGAIERTATTALNSSESNAARSDWVWPCDKCSDPVCEHRLFTRLGLESSVAPKGY